LGVIEICSFSYICSCGIRTSGDIPHGISGNLGVGSGCTYACLGDGITGDVNTRSCGVGSVPRELSIGERSGTEGDGSLDREYPTCGFQGRSLFDVDSHLIKLGCSICICGSCPCSTSSDIYTVLCCRRLVLNEDSVPCYRSISVYGL